MHTNLQLIIGNKNYSSWSMRPWLLLRGFGIAFDELKVRFDSFEPGSRFKTRLAGFTPTGRVPVPVSYTHLTLPTKRIV